MTTVNVSREALTRLLVDIDRLNDPDCFDTPFCYPDTPTGKDVAELKRALDQPAEQPSEFDAFQSEFSEWAFATFKEQTVEAKLRHAIKEIGEIIDKPDDIDEWGDLFMLMCNAAKLQGFTLTEIRKAARAKWQNDLVHREWLPPDEDGCVHHVKVEQETAD